MECKKEALKSVPESCCGGAWECGRRERTFAEAGITSPPGFGLITNYGRRDQDHKPRRAKWRVPNEVSRHSILGGPVGDGPVVDRRSAGPGSASSARPNQRSEIGRALGRVEGS